MTFGNVPGTAMPYQESEGMFSIFRPMIRAAGGLSLNQICSLTGLEPSTIQNWIKRGFVAHPVNKKYFERQLARILMISALRDSMRIEQIGELMQMVNGDSDNEDDDIISEAQLYDYFCEVIRQSDTGGISQKEVARIIELVTSGYDAPDSDAKERLKNALQVMVLAYGAGLLKREADMFFNQIKKSFKEEK